MRIFSRLLIASILFVQIGTPFVSHADGPAITIPVGAGGQEITNGSFSLGWTFTVNSPLSVSALGFYDDGQNGISFDHDVAIYDQGCGLVASTTVTPSDSLIGAFRYHQLNSPVTLNPGQTYIAASVTGSEKYLYNPTTVTVDTAVTFQRFTIWNFVQQTSSLQCPNTPAASFYYGDFGPSFYIGTFPGGESGGTRSVGLRLFCNRTGSNLETVKCSVTVGDAGAPPRTAPTGTVNFAATGGLSPSTAACTLVQTPFSPGVAACDAEFSLPVGFPIGVAFPIDASYEGDTTFDAASTSASLIQAGCIGEPGNPCPGAVSISFADLPQIVKGSISTIFECGNAKNVPASAAIEAADLSPFKFLEGVGDCTGTILSSMNLSEILAAMELEQIQQLSGGISVKDAKQDTVLGALRSLGSAKNQQLLQNGINNAKQMDALLQKLINEQIKLDGGVLKTLKRFNLRKARLKPVIQIGAAQISAKNNSRKVLKVKLTKLGTKLSKLFKAAGKGDVNLTFKFKGKRAKGKKYPFAGTQTIDVGLS